MVRFSYDWGFIHSNIECTELVLHIVLGRDDLKVENVETQHLIKHLQGRSIILDISKLSIEEVRMLASQKNA